MPIAPRRLHMAVLFWFCMTLWAAPLAMAQSPDEGPSPNVRVENGGARPDAGLIALPMFVCCVGIPALALFAFWIWALVDCLRRDFPGNEKLLWVLVIIFASWIGAIIYLLIGRAKGTLPRDRGGV